MSATKDVGRQVKDNAEWEWLARLGMAARGLLYVIVAALAVKVALGEGGDTTGQKGALSVLVQQPMGKVLLVAVAIGLAALAVASFLQAIKGPGNKPKDDPAWGKRLSRATQGVVAASLAFSAAKLVIGAGGTGGESASKKATGGVLGWPGGQVLVGLVALGLLGWAGYSIYRGVSGKFMKELNVSGTAERTARALGGIGYVGRGLVIAVISWFLAKAAWEFDPKEAVSLDGALGKLVAQSYGRAALFVVAIGLLAFGAYCFFEARYRDLSTRD